MSFPVEMSPIWPVGYSSSKTARNGRVVNASPLAQIIGLSNSIMGRRLRSVWQKCIPLDQAYSAGAGPRVIGRGYFKVAPTARFLIGVVGYVPAIDTYLGTGSPFWRFNVNGTPGPDFITQPIASISSITEVLRPRWQLCKIYNAAAGDQVTLGFEIGNGALPLFVNVYEVPSTTIDCDSFSGSAYGVDPRLASQGASVDTGLWSALGAQIMNAWNLLGTCHFNWSHMTGGSVDNATATDTNILDGDTGGWTSTAAGFYFHPAGRDRQFKNPDTAPAKCWVYAECSTSDGEVKFSHSDGTIATVSVNSNTPQIFTADGAYSTLFTEDLVTVESNGGTGTTKVYAAGMYDRPW